MNKGGRSPIKYTSYPVFSPLSQLSSLRLHYVRLFKFTIWKEVIESMIVFLILYSFSQLHP